MLAVAVLAGACGFLFAAPSRADTPPGDTVVVVPRATAAPKADPSMVGLATWYGGRHPRGVKGRLTAAHRHLAMGTKLKVTNLRNGRSVVVTVNDRGILGPGRIIDVSLAAAHQLAMVSDGVVPVRLELVEAEKTAP
jgi:rare lipoprotein A